MTNLNKYLNKVIKSAILDESSGHVFINFTDGTGFRLSDDMQQCCEQRYITCDDDLNDLVGQSFAGIEVKPVDYNNRDDFDIEETCFIEIKTNVGSVSLCTHNEHNGFYGGFNITIIHRGNNND